MWMVQLGAVVQQNAFQPEKSVEKFICFFYNEYSYFIKYNHESIYNKIAKVHL